MVQASSVNLSCPDCDETFAAVFSEETETARIVCPMCDNEFAVVRTVETDGTASEDGETRRVTATVLDWRVVDVRDPYSGSESDIPVEQRVKADVAVDGTTYSFDLYYTPEYHYFQHVVRGQLESGQKSKNAFEDAETGELYFTNRGVPWNDDKQWTYLGEDQCRKRSKIAGLGEVVRDPDSDKSNRFRTYLGEQNRPLLDSNGDLDATLVETLVKGLVVFQTNS